MRRREESSGGFRLNDLLRELYEETILDHYKRPRNQAVLPEVNREAEGYNPLCGDHIVIHLFVEDDKIAGVQFDSAGCAICTASASLMSEAIKGKSLEDAAALFSKFQTAVTTEVDTEELGDLEILVGVRNHPVRIKCATLAWHTMMKALRNEGGSVSTE